MSDDDNSMTMGMIAAFVAIIALGLYPVPLRLKRVVEVNVSPMVYLFYAGTGVALVSMTVLIWSPFIWTWYGVAGGALWVATQPLFFSGISFLGLTVSPPIVCGTTITVSFLWGYYFFEEPVTSLGLCYLSICVMLLGIILIIMTGSSLPDRVSEMWGSKRGYTAIPNNSTVQRGRRESSEETEPAQETKRTKMDMIFGVLCAFTAGIMTGSYMVPVSLFVEQEQDNYPGELIAISYLFSFGVGIFMSIPVVATLYFLGRREIPVLHFKIVVLPGLLSGFFWGLGNVASVYAVAFLGNVVGYPLTQTNIVVGGILGVVVFKEIKGCGIVFFTVATITLLGGVGMLAIFGSPSI